MSLHSLTQKQFFELTPPRSGKVISRDLNDTGELLRVPSSWIGRIIHFCCIGADGYLLTGDATLAVTVTDRSAVDATTRVITPDVNTPSPIPQGVIVPYQFDEVDAYFNIRAAAGESGAWYAWPGSPTRSGENP